MILAIGLWTFLRTLFTGFAAVALENLALRHQLLVLQRSVGRPRLARRDRVLWVWLSQSARGIGSCVYGGRHAGHCHAHCGAHICPACGQLPSHLLVVVLVR